jgi:hypothetical protein
MKISGLFSAKAAFLAGLALSALPAATRAADVSLIGVLKGQSFIQDNPVGPRLSEDDPLFFEAFVNPTGPNAVTAASVRLLPNGTLINLQNDDGEWNLEADFDSKLDLDSTFPPGDYQLSIDTANDGSRSLTLTLLADAYPNPPRISNFSAAQSIDSTQNFTLQWDALTGGTADDFIKVEIEQVDSHDTIFETGEPGEGNALNGTHTSVQINADTLVPGQRYRVSIFFVKPTDVDDETYPGATGIVGYICETELSIRTAGLDPGDDTPPSVSATPDGFSDEVPVNSAIAFLFSEPMDTTINVPASITWTGVNGNNFSYSWNSRGDRLFAIPTAPLPLSTEISWTLNPNGSPQAFGDPIGNKLPTTGGSFTTSPDDNSNAPDLTELYLVKGRGFHQTGANAEENGDYFLSIGAELTGYNTVTHATLTLPGGAVISLEPSSYDMNLELEAEYTFKADLDSFFPNGLYSVTLHTVHDGIRTFALNLGPDAYPNPPTFSDIAALQAVDPAADFSLQWNPFLGGTGDDFIFVEIERNSNFGRREVFTSPGTGDPEVLDGESTAITIPAFTLAPGRSFETLLLFVKILDSDETTYPGALAISGFVSETEVEMLAAGEIFTPQLEALGINGGQFQLRLTGEKDFPYLLDNSTNLLNWSGLGTYWPDTPVAGKPFLAQVDLSFAASGPKRFYRAIENTTFNNGGDPVWSVLFTTAIEITPCNGGNGPLYFGSQVIQVDEGGNFASLWPRGQEPDPGELVARLHGSLGDTFNANLDCYPGGTNLTTLAASPQSGGYHGNFTSGSSSGTFWVITQTGMVSIHGRVVNLSNNPVAGAVVSTNLDTQTATSDSNGAFFLQTNTPANFANHTPYTIFINGVSQGSQTWGDYPWHQSFQVP